MKQFLFFLAISCITNMTMAQNSGVITFQEVRKLEINFEGNAPEGMDIKSMLPTSTTNNMILKFDGMKGIYSEGKNESNDTELESDDGSFKMVIMDSSVESKIYSDYKSKELIQQEGFLGKPFIIKSNIDKSTWKITSEKVSYLNYDCIKATMIDDDEKEIIAWFAPSLPTSVGPSGYGGLPGAILMLARDGDKLSIKAMEIDLKEVNEIEKPTEGKEVTREEYDKIMEDKIKEMTEERGGRSFQIGG